MRKSRARFQPIITPKKLVYFILFWTIISDTLQAELGLSGTIQYLNDIAWVVLFVYVFERNFPARFEQYGLRWVLRAMVLYAGVCFISAAVNLVDPLLVLWATRNALRFFVFYIACVVYLEQRDIDRIFNALFYIQILSFAIALYQYYILGFHMDNLGGIFGHGNGAALNTFQAMLFAYYLCGYLKRKQPLFRVLFVFVTSVIIAALAEEKASFVYLAVVIVGSLLFNKLSLKSIAIVVLAAVLIPVGITLLSTVNDAWNLDVLTDFSKALDYMTTSYKINRLNPYPQISALFFNNSSFHALFGIGFGGAEFCEATSLFTSAFFRQYSYLQYADFTQQKILIETGIMGFATYLSFFAANIYSVWKRAVKYRLADYRYRSAAIFGVVAILSCWFSGALIFGDAYLVFFGIAAGAVVCKPCEAEAEKCAAEPARGRAAVRPALPSVKGEMI